MFLNAVILILQEILEAMLLISVMLVLASVLRAIWGETLPRKRWLIQAVATGLGGALLYAWATPELSTWFNYAGYEIINGALQFCTIVLLLGFCFMLNPRSSFLRAEVRNSLVGICMVAMVALGIIREGSEIILYGIGIIGQQQNITPVLFGGMVATGICISSGWFLYQVLHGLAYPASFRSAMVLLALFAGNMAAGSVLLFTQADWLPYSPELWDSSGLLSESGITGQLLYAMIGYEATPSLLQAGGYFAAVLLVMLSPLFRLAWKNPGMKVGNESRE